MVKLDVNIWQMGYLFLEILSKTLTALTEIRSLSRIRITLGRNCGSAKYYLAREMLSWAFPGSTGTRDACRKASRIAPGTQDVLSQCHLLFLLLLPTYCSNQRHLHFMFQMADAVKLLDSEINHQLAGISFCCGVRQIGFYMLPNLKTTSFQRKKKQKQSEKGQNIKNAFVRGIDQ